MSLKAFHIVFVIVSVLLSAFVGRWGVVAYRNDAQPMDLVVGIVAIVMGVLLVWYSTWFIRKIRAIGSA